MLLENIVYLLVLTDTVAVFYSAALTMLLVFRRLI